MSVFFKRLTEFAFEGASADRRSDLPARRPGPATGLILLALLVFAPLAFGAVDFWSIGVVELLVLGLALASFIEGIVQGRPTLEPQAALWPALGFVVWVGIQFTAGCTVDVASTRAAFLLLVSYFLLFLVVINEPWRGRDLQRLGKIMAAIGFGVALLGLVQFLAWNGKLYWVRPIREGTPFGPYVNHNHFAGLMEIIFPVALSFALRRREERAWRALFAFFAAVMALAVVVSLSRGGMVSLAAGGVLFLALQARRRGTGRTLQVATVIAVLVGAGLLLVGAQPVVARLATFAAPGREASVHSRLLVARDTLRIIRDHPLAGTGLGTFPLVIPRYLSFDTRWRWQKAHNDYLQLVAETGLVGLGLAVGWLVACFAAFRRNLPADRLAGLRLGAFCGCVALLVHSFVDFNLQIPANAVYFVVLAALATRPCSSQDHGSPGAR